MKSKSKDVPELDLDTFEIPHKGDGSYGIWSTREASEDPKIEGPYSKHGSFMNDGVNNQGQQCVHPFFSPMRGFVYGLINHHLFLLL